MSNGYGAAAMADADIPKGPGVEYTGRYLVLLDQDDPKAGLNALAKGAGVSAADHVPSGDSGIHTLEQRGSVVLDDLGVALVAADPDQRSALEMTVASTPSLLTAEPERVLHAYTASLEPRGVQTGCDRHRRARQQQRAAGGHAHSGPGTSPMG